MDKGSIKIAILALACLWSCSEMVESLEVGVSLTLSKERKVQLSDIAYRLHFELPEEREAPVFGSVEISFTLQKRGTVTLDFKAEEHQIKTLYVNGSQRQITFVNEHIVIPAKYLASGENRVKIDFIAGDQSLNRNDDYLYTLLVPDRARTLFPCFDQPDLKAIYTLSLAIPRTWKAVANGKTGGILPIAENQIELHFEPTEPLSTYLFSFVAGNFQQRYYLNKERPITLFHRETDADKLTQIDLIAEQIYFCLNWMEEYTGIPYPFAKYDAIILPGFQYGGMEHTGATLFNDKRLILGARPTTEEELSRFELIAHEVAHLWFGNYVTMKWFDDVWTKEVFAGYFASLMIAPLFPQIDHKLNAIKRFIPPAYSEDRTQGAVSIKQPLDNLQDAGLVYGKTIYNKAPVVMRMLADQMGAEAFRSGLQEYLQKFAYGNADWDDLIDILDSYASQDLKAWSRMWVYEKGMPEVDHIDPNGYGFFRLDAENLQLHLNRLSDFNDPATRLWGLINLHEHLARNLISPSVFAPPIVAQLPREENVQIFGSMLAYLQAAVSMDSDLAILAERALWRLVQTHPNREFRQLAFNVLIEKAITPTSVSALLDIWQSQRPPTGITLSENQYMTLAYELAVRLPKQADAIVTQQLLRLKHPDKIREFTFISPAVSPLKEVRDSLFCSLLKAQNRMIEPWAIRALRFLNHPLRQEEALDYIVPALEILPEIQRTGDIFLPPNWCAALLDGHYSLPAAQVLVDFLEKHQDMPSLLKSKITQNGDRLLSMVTP